MSSGIVSESPIVEYTEIVAKWKPTIITEVGSLRLLTFGRTPIEISATASIYLGKAVVVVMLQFRNV